MKHNEGVYKYVSVIPLYISISGNCSLDNNAGIVNCSVGDKIIIESVFKNVSNMVDTKTIAILVNDYVVVSKTITFKPEEEYKLLYNLEVVNEEPYDVCSIVY